MGPKRVGSLKISGPVWKSWDESGPREHKKVVGGRLKFFENYLQERKVSMESRTTEANSIFPSILCENNKGFSTSRKVLPFVLINRGFLKKFNYSESDSLHQYRTKIRILFYGNSRKWKTGISNSGYFNLKLFSCEPYSQLKLKCLLACKFLNLKINNDLKIENLN